MNRTGRISLPVNEWICKRLTGYGQNQSSPHLPSLDTLIDKAKAFQQFLDSYAGNVDAIENKELLQKLLLEAKSLGEQVLYHFFQRQ